MDVHGYLYICTHPPWRNISLQWHQAGKVPLLHTSVSNNYMYIIVHVIILTSGMIKLVVSSRACLLIITF